MSPRLRALVAVLALLAATEVGLRATGRGPWAPFDDLATVPVLSAADPELGWTNLPGDHRWDGPTGEVTVHIEPDGARGHAGPGDHRVVLLGGSFVFGFGLSDDEVLSHHLEASRRELSVHNLAVPGYGTLQSLLLAERLDLAGTTVVYGLVELHEARNVAAPSWLRGLERASRGEAWSGVPAASWDGEQLHRAPPRRTQHWALSERVALVDAVERAWVALRDWGTATKGETTVQLVVALDETVTSAGGRLVVAALDLPTQEAFYRRRLTEEGLEWVALPVATRLPDGHPDAATHRAWATALAEVL